MTSTTAPDVGPSADDERAPAPAVQRPAPPAWLARWAKTIDYLQNDLLGGPKVIKLAWVINFQKAGTLPFVLGLMWLFNDFSTDAWVYAALHGSYGLAWLIKDVAFPDPTWQRRVTIASAFGAFALVLGPYWLAPLILTSGWFGVIPEASGPVLFGSIFLYALGVVLMIASDAQKTFTLRLHKGLIDDGMFARVRHTNYLGEMLLYGAFALLVRHWLPVVVLAYVWGLVFLKNMLMKEVSLSRHPGWAAYKERSGMLLPRLF